MIFCLAYSGSTILNKANDKVGRLGFVYDISREYILVSAPKDTIKTSYIVR